MLVIKRLNWVFSLIESYSVALAEFTF